MMYGFFGRVSSATDIKAGLDASAARMRSIADRVAKASVGGTDGFALPDGTFQPAAKAPNTNLESDMASLADEEIRNEAQSHLLSKAYESVREALKA